MSANSPLHDNLIVDKTFNFAVLIVHFVRKLQESKNFVIANQLLKSGTSIGANVREAQNSESLADFIHKFKIAAKEADETEYWILLCKEAIKDLNLSEIEKLLIEIKIIQKILTKIIASSKSKQKINK